jgi:hypothetical protein
LQVAVGHLQGELLAAGCIRRLMANSLSQRGSWFAGTGTGRVRLLSLVLLPRPTLAFTTNTFGAGTSVDIPLIRSALLALVDSTLQGRLIAGEH